MSSDNSMEQGTTSSEGNVQPAVQPIALPLYAVQLINVVPIEIAARRFPSKENSAILSTDTQINPPTVQLNLEEPLIFNEIHQAQALFSIHVLSTDMPPLFEISLKLASLFTYDANYEQELVRQFLRQGSLSVVLPFARELLLSVCTRLQIPLIALPLIQLAPPPTDTQPEGVPQE